MDEFIINPEYKDYRQLAISEETWVDLKSRVFDYLRANSHKSTVTPAEIQAIDPLLTDTETFLAMKATIQQEVEDKGRPATEAAMKQNRQERRIGRKEFDITNSASFYIGFADVGTPTMSSSWTIKKVDFNASGEPIAESWTAEHSASWDNRLSETYK